MSAFKKPHLYRSVSALAPICDITRARHSNDALESYLGPQAGSNWQEWSAICLANRYEGPPLRILIDQVNRFFLLNCGSDSQTPESYHSNCF